MSYYDDKTNVESYIQMAEGYDGSYLIEGLKPHLKAGASVLELGMGPGKDYLLLSEHYNVTGSDASAIFVERFRQQHPAANVMRLDAITMDTDRIFNAIYSNKVLYHLTPTQLKTSLQRQAQRVSPGGVLLHSFWYGDQQETMHGLTFVYYTEATIKPLVGDEYELLEIQRYTEMETDDSFYLLLRRKNSVLSSVTAK